MGNGKYLQNRLLLFNSQGDIFKAHIENYTKIITMSVKLLSNLDFAAKLNSVEAVTESGKEFLKNYRGYMYQHASSCGIVNGFIQESQNYGYDTGIMTILESVLKYVN